MMYSKYKAKRTEVDGRWFDSQAEASRYCQLQLLAQADQIRGLECQVPFALKVNGVLITKYYADFVYFERVGGSWRRIVEDVKGYRTAAYKLKKKLMLACHNIAIRETR